jgi:hypothetical protein
MMRLRSLSWPVVVGIATLGCGEKDDNNPPADAKPVDGTQPDGPTPDAADVANFGWDEGGEVRIEYQQILTPNGTNLRTRATAFLWKSKDPARAEFAAIPGCTKMDMDDRFPLAMGTSHTYLDVGQVVITGGAQQFTIPPGPNPGKDGLLRPHDGHWNFLVADNMGTTFTGNFNAPYSVVFTGSPGTDDWPAQTFNNAIYMGPQWELDTPGFEPIQLVADTPITITYKTPNPPTNGPAKSDHASYNMVAALVIPPFGPVVDCISDDTELHTITIPADMVNHARALGSSGLLARAHVSHQVQELTDGVTHNHKRIDFISVWCYVTPWTAQ